MKITLENIGPLRYAEMTLGDITIVCGCNNTGKTYATYALYGFLDYWHEGYTPEVKDNHISTLIDRGKVNIPLSLYALNPNKELSRASMKYSKLLYKIFGGEESRFKNSKFVVEASAQKLIAVKKYKVEIGSVKESILGMMLSKDGKSLEVSLLLDKKSDDIPPKHFISRFIGDAIKAILFSSEIPNKNFIASAERTGAAIFGKELDFSRNRLLELIGDKKAKIDPIRLLGKFNSDYALPVKDDVDFTRNLPNIIKKTSFIQEKYGSLLQRFRDIIGGEYKVKKDDLYFVPVNCKSLNLPMGESSSAVRSLLDVGFYLKHEAQVGDILIIDEPELNLHPENQRRVARLFACLVNIGIKVFITTHSDYIIKEINALIMLNTKGNKVAGIKEKFGYTEQEMLSANKVKVYIAEKASVKLDENRYKSKVQTLTKADVDSEYGIEARSFDTTIDEMNDINDAIIFSEDE